MCVVNGSIDQYISSCPMCKVFKPTNSRCPHKKETCRNHGLHPRHDVVYFKNAEVPMFNGCGYCKYAMTNPPLNKSGYNNPGWPGCCRPPQPNEFNLIKPAEWHAVSIIYRIPIPADVKALLDQAFKSVTGSLGRNHTTSSISEKKTNHTTSKMSTPNGSPRSSTIAIPTLKSRQGGSPQMKPSSLVGIGSSSRLVNALTATMSTGDSPGSAPTSQPQPTSRRSGSIDKPIKRIEGFRTTPPGNTRKLSDLETSSQVQKDRSPNGRNGHGQVAVTASVLSTMGNGDETISARPSLKRRPSSASSTRASPEPASTRISTTHKSTKSGTITNASRSIINLSNEIKAMSLISDNSSDSSSRSSDSSLNDDSTVTSEGFTDYLSDESDAELQRQAEIRAAVLEQNRQEEEEFKAARQQLTSIGLRPPQAWDSRVAITSTPGRGYGRHR